MKFLKKATVAFAVMSMVSTPIAASAAAPRFNDLRADSQLQNKGAKALGEDEGAESYILLLLAAIAAGFGIERAFNGSDRTPTSP